MEALHHTTARPGRRGLECPETDHESWRRYLLATDPATPRWRRRHTVVGLCAGAVFLCYIDRVNISVAIIPMAARFEWDRATQGAVLSAFFVGYLLTQIVGGRLADRFGGKLVLGAGVLLWSLFTALTPPAAALGLTVLLLARVGLGLGEAVTFPSTYSLFARWVPERERARSIALINSGIPAGTLFALLVTPPIVERFGWPWAFYVFGGLGAVWLALWRRYASASPALHPGVGAEERRESPDPTDLAVPPPALRALLRRREVWAIVVAHFCNNWSLYVLLSWLPTFVNQGLGVDFADVGLYTMIPHVASFVMLNVAGTIADRLIVRGMQRTFVRKLMQAIGGLGISAALLVVGHVHTVWAAIALMAVGNGLGAFVTGGFASNHMDLAPRSAGTLMGLTNTAGTIPGVVGVYVTGLILAWTGSWVLVFGVTAGVTLAGLAFYLVCADTRQLFD